MTSERGNSIQGTGSKGSGKGGAVACEISSKRVGGKNEKRGEAVSVVHSGALEQNGVEGAGESEEGAFPGAVHGERAAAGENRKRRERR